MTAVEVESLWVVEMSHGISWRRVAFDWFSDVILTLQAINVPANVKSFISLYDLRLVATEAYGMYFTYKKAKWSWVLWGATVMDNCSCEQELHNERLVEGC